MKNLGGNDLINNIAEKAGLSTDQASSVMDNALPMLMDKVKENGLSADLLSSENISSIAQAVSDKVGIAPETITNALSSIAPQLSELLEGKGGNLMDMAKDFLDKDKNGSVLDNIKGMFNF
ncbi:MAG: DUF937 domain-containing protein [Bergeyella zoohelcum]|nr:DUF937 domain-containing protein [Bergeyella zoohelcum]